MGECNFTLYCMETQQQYAPAISNERATTKEKRSRANRQCSHSSPWKLDLASWETIPQMMTIQWIHFWIWAWPKSSHTWQIQHHEICLKYYASGRYFAKKKESWECFRQWSQNIENDNSFERALPLMNAKFPHLILAWQVHVPWGHTSLSDRLGQQAGTWQKQTYKIQ